MIRIPETRWTYGLQFLRRGGQLGVIALDGGFFVWGLAWDWFWGFWFTDHRTRSS